MIVLVYTNFVTLQLIDQPKEKKQYPETQVLIAFFLKNSPILTCAIYLSYNYFPLWFNPINHVRHTGDCMSHLHKIRIIERYLTRERTERKHVHYRV